MNRQSQSQISESLVAVAPLVPLLVWGWLISGVTSSIAATAPENLAQVKTISSDRLLSQIVVETLPPPPAINLSKEQSSPAFTPREVDFAAPIDNPASITSESYLVYIDEASSSTLEQVRQLEPSAFVKQYNGRSIIQTGVFNKDLNAQQQAETLQLRGFATRIVSLNNGEEIEFIANSKSYFVVIPARQADLALIENQVRQLSREIPTNISQKEEPRGSHVRVGPFAERSQAEQLNRYIVDAGLKNARVYFGR